MSDPSLYLGRDPAEWRERLQVRFERLQRLLDQRVPGFVVSNETTLIRQALDAIDELAGDRATSDAILEQLAAGAWCEICKRAVADEEGRACRASFCGLKPPRLGSAAA